MNLFGKGKKDPYGLKRSMNYGVKQYFEPSQWNMQGAQNKFSTLLDPANLFGWDDGPEEDPYAGMPMNYPSYVGMEGNDTQTPIEWDRRAEGKFNEYALRDGPSKATMLALDENADMARMAKSNVRNTASSLAGQARDQLATRGGLDSGASERIAKAAMGNALDLNQQVEAGAMQNRAGINLADEQARVAGLETAVGMNMNTANSLFGMRNQNKQALERENARRNAYNMNNYNQAMQGWAAGKQAQATADSGKK